MLQLKVNPTSGIARFDFERCLKRYGVEVLEEMGRR